MSIRVASAPVSWGIMENVPAPPEYSYTRVLDEIAQAGYSGTELGPYGFLPVDAYNCAASWTGEALPCVRLLLPSHWVTAPSMPAASLKWSRRHN